MKVYLHTLRYGFESNLEYHGDRWYHNEATGILNVYEPVEEVKLTTAEGEERVKLVVGAQAIVTICAGDRLLIVECEEGCTFHPVKKLAKPPATLTSPLL